MLIPDPFNSLQLLIFDLLSAFGLRDLDPFLVLQLITDSVTINFPNTVDNLLPSRPRLIYTPFLYIVEYMVSHTLVIIIDIIYMNEVAVTSPTTSYPARSAASLPYTLFSSSTHDSLEVRSLFLSSDVSWIGSIISLVVRYVSDRLNRFSCLMYIVEVPSVTSTA